VELDLSLCSNELDLILCSSRTRPKFMFKLN
jgi:hypothetical protein